MSAIEESGIPLKVHIGFFKQMAESGCTLMAESAKARIKELEGLIAQPKPEEKKLEWKPPLFHSDIDMFMSSVNWCYCEYKFHIYKLYAEVSGCAEYHLHIKTITPTPWTLSTNSQIVVTMRKFKFDSFEEAKAKAEEIAKVLELL